jgi:hypothetical protein
VSPPRSWVLDGPWEQGELIALAGRITVGLVGLLVAWIGCSGTLSWPAQQGWTVVGVGAVALSMTGVVMWIQTGLRAVQDAKREVFAATRERFRLDDVPAAEPIAALPPIALVVGAELVTGSGMTLYHRPECLLVVGKATSSITRCAADAAALDACRVCNP